MDPASAIGVASAALTIVNLIARNVASLSDLQTRYKSADRKVGLLIGQLSTIKAALNQIANLLRSDAGNLRDPELIDDFSTSLGCVEAVVIVLNDRITLVQRKSANALTTWSKFAFMWDEKTVNDYGNLLNNQVQALGLLLTALQCRTTLEQTDLLQSREARDIFNRVKDDTSSLLCLRDADSGISHQSSGAQDVGTADATFTFDSDVLNSKAYQTATRSDMICAFLSARRNVPNSVTGPTPPPASVQVTHTIVTGHVVSKSEDTVSGNLRPQVCMTPPQSPIRSKITTECSSNSPEKKARRLSCVSNLGFCAPDSENIQNTVTGPQVMPESSASPQAHKRYIIHTQRTLGLLPCVKGSLGASPQSLQPSLAVSGNPGPSNTTGDSSICRHMISRQRSGDSYLPHPRRPEDTAFFRADEPGVKVLVLGISDSGKTTLRKSMKIASDTAGKEWRLSYRPAIYMSLVLSLKYLASRTGHHESNPMDLPEEDVSRYEIAKNYGIIDEWLRANAWVLDEMYSFAPSVASAIIYLSQNDNIRAAHDRIMKRSATEGAHPYITDCTQQYMTSASRIVDPDYIPTFQDVLLASNKTLGLHEYHYFLGDTLYQFFDFSGTKVERQVCQGEHGDADSIIFTLDVSCYDQVFIQESATKRMTEQLKVWESLVQSSHFAATNFIVLFTKVDKVTPSKLEDSPFSSSFPDYSGKPDSLEDILQYLAWRLDTASEDWKDRRLVFCNAGSIWDSPKLMAEVAVAALTEGGSQKFVNI